MKIEFIDHAVIIVKDDKRSADFYSKFLGKSIQTDEEQVAFQVGETKLFFGLSYGEFEKYDKDKGGLNHLAFGVRNLDELKKFEDILEKAGIQHSRIIIDKYGKKEFIWFDDPDGIRLEFYLRES